jgi:S1-C subfamily serine protease
MPEANTRRHVAFTLVTTLGALLVIFFAARGTPEPLPPKPHYLGADLDLSASGISGVRLSAIKPDSPAEKARLQVGDIIVKLGTVTIKNPEDFDIALKSTTPRRPAEVIYLRQGKESRTQVFLEPRR